MKAKGSLPGMLPLSGVAAIWFQLYASLMPVWRSGEYYGYGWFVPPAAAVFLWRRWWFTAPTSDGRLPWFSLCCFALALVPSLWFLRSVNAFDPSWRPPMLVHALLAVLASHWVASRFFGWRVSLQFAPVTLYALSALPYPWQIEQQVIQILTGWVLQSASLMLTLLGTHTVVSGTLLVHSGISVEVTHGCSGIRSLQSLVMASLFFGELFFLRIGRRIVLLLAGIALAVISNACRAIVLAKIHFQRGASAGDAAHDLAGHVSFAVSAALLFLVVIWLLYRQQRRQCRSR